MSENWLLPLVLGVIAAAFVFLRSSPTELADETAFDEAITSGQPTIVEFYSNY
ncbi:MAG: hypothetical protein KAS81_09405 [Anaerolineales bacterium]|nr:hypothetical protein [Anaerolineales bacterium]